MPKEIIPNSLSLSLVNDVRSIIDNGRKQAYSAVNSAMVETYWHIGRRIVEEEQHGEQRAEYGKQLIKQLSIALTHEYGKGFSARYLAYFRKFYLTVPDIKILQTRLQNLHWSHQDVGQMDMYVRMYDELKRTEGDNPTIGIVLCSETSQDIARYSILKGNEQLFAAKYMPILPTKEELKREIEHQKQLFLMQKNSNNN